jgi:integrase
MTTGMRAGEIRSLKRSYIGKNFLRIPLEQTKTDDSNTTEKGVKVIPISASMRKIFIRQPRVLRSDVLKSF